VAGTKGKGTTCLYTENIIQTYSQRHGRKNKIGCLTSPHITSVRERIRIDSQPVSEHCFAAHFWSLWKELCPDEPATRSRGTTPPLPGYPGFITLLAFHIFNEEAVDLAILETGMGGETDSTNVVTSPVATGIAELGLDHVNRLGDTLEQIAWHKGGIFKFGVPAFSVPQKEAAVKVLQQRANEKNTELQFVDNTFLSNNCIDVVPNEEFQRSNASLALALAGEYLKRLTPPGRIDSDIARCVERTELPAKFEIILQGKISWVLSSAHNDMSVEAACEAFMHFLQERPDCLTALLFSHDSHRDSEKMLRSIFDRICLTGNRPFRVSLFCPEILDESTYGKQDFCDFRKSSVDWAAAVQQQESMWRNLGNKGAIKTVPSVRSAIQYVRNMDMESIVFVIGSAYTAGMARCRLTI